MQNRLCRLRSTSYPQAENPRLKVIDPSSRRPARSIIVFVGRDRRGNWVVREQNGTFGGMFVNRSQAIKYALFENGHHPEGIFEVSREIDLYVPAKP